MKSKTNIQEKGFDILYKLHEKKKKKKKKKKKRQKTKKKKKKKTTTKNKNKQTKKQYFKMSPAENLPSTLIV